MRRVRRPLLALVVLVAAVVVGYVVREVRGTQNVRPTISFAALPVQAQQCIARVARHGPYPYPEDGEVFHNYEHLLPSESDGYYHSYTVVTPGSPDRGARRIVTGGRDYWYTADHYDSFDRVTAVP